MIYLCVFLAFVLGLVVAWLCWAIACAKQMRCGVRLGRFRPLKFLTDWADDLLRAIYQNWTGDPKRWRVRFRNLRASRKRPFSSGHHGSVRLAEGGAFPITPRPLGGESRE